jgi:uncharacterized protein (TIGR02453 family)
MSDSLALNPVLDFLCKLETNNNREWFELNRALYQQAKERFEGLVDHLIEGIGRAEDLGGITAKDCTMRIFRDVRFSKDKTPYQTHMGASIVPGGRKSSRLPFYLHVAPNDQSFIAGGMHLPDGAQLAVFRSAIARDASKFKAIVGAELFGRYFAPSLGESLKTTPKGYAADHPEIDLLRLKEICAVHRLSDEAVLSEGFPAHVLEVHRAMRPFLEYMNSVNKV